MRSEPSAFWSLPISDLYRQLDAKTDGLTEAEAKARLKQYGSNLLREEKETTALSLFLAQFKSPIILLSSGISYKSTAIGNNQLHLSKINGYGRCFYSIDQRLKKFRVPEYMATLTSSS
jgi:magnesium-transporting ATPase (P-type)